MNEQIRQIIEEFDFELVRAVMKALEWTWLGSDEPPTVGQMVLKAVELLNEVADKEDGSSSAVGGFEAVKENGRLLLRFVVEEWEYCGEKEKE